METQPVVISNITLTKPTQDKTGYGENDLQLLLNDTKFADQQGELTVKIEFSQKREIATIAPTSTNGRRQSLFSIADTMKGHSKVITGDRYKKFWINSMNLTSLQEKGFVIGADYGQLTNTVAFLLTEEYETADFRDDRIVSSPKRKGKGGNILLSAAGKFIFQDTQLVTNESSKEFAEFDYADFVKFEESAKIPFKSEIDAAEVPDETKTNGFFNAEFEAWLTEQYADRNELVLTSVE